MNDHEYLHSKIISIFFFFIFKLYFINGTVVSKCYYDGDFTVNCNSTKLPILADTVEVLRFIKVINGIQFKENYCHFTNLTCYKEEILTKCIDKQNCFIKNSWFYLPECRANSYYTELDYECQPRFYMCEKTTINNLFSGLILSPAYPHSYKLSSPKPCYLTVQVPADHYIEITLDYFSLVKSHKCLSDYLNIQEYVDIETKSHGRKRQWRTISTLCGQKEPGHVLIIKSDTISFTFRSFDASTVSAFDDLKFKIHFQAIPSNVVIPDSKTKIENDLVTKTDVQILDKYTKKISSTSLVSEPTTTVGNTKMFWLKIGFGIGALVIFLIILAIVLIIILMKRTRPENIPSSNNQNLKKNINTNKGNSDLNKKKYENNKNTDLEESETFLRNSSNSTTISGNKLANKNENHLKVPKISGLNNGVKNGASNESEPKKMQAERSPLLKDLSQSKLLNKFKSESINSPIEEPKLEKISEASSPKIDFVKNSVDNVVKSFEFGGIYGTESTEIDSGVYFGSKPLTSAPIVSEVKQSDICSKNDSKTKEIIELNNIKEEVQKQLADCDQTDLQLKNDETFSKIKETEIIDCKKIEISENSPLNEKQNENSRALNTENSNQIEEINNELAMDDENRKSLIFSEENLGVVSGMASIIDDTENIHESRVSLTNTTPRKTKFNPLHVILKDKNKYYTTEYV